MSSALQSPITRDRYDVVIAGARCAGASTAMLLARQGLRVLVVDPTSRGSDTLSTHALMRGGVLQLHRWGLLEAIRAGKAPAAILTSEVDAFLALASIVADEMYQKPLPVIALEPDDFARLKTGQEVRVFADGRVEVYSSRAASSS